MERQLTDFEEKMIQVNRVSKKIRGGNKVRYSVLMAVGNRAGQVGVALGKAPEVSTAVKKAIIKAKKNLIIVPRKGNTIPGVIKAKFGGATVLLKPAVSGRGVVAGGSSRVILELSGVADVSVKMLGNSNKINNAYATIKALKELSKIVSKQEC